MNDSVRSAARALDLLEYFATAMESVALTTVSATFGMPKSSTLALLRTLQLRGYVVRDGRGLYCLNDDFRHRGFGWAGDSIARLVAVARPAMEALCAEVGETVLLGTLDEKGNVRFVAKTVADSVVRYDVDLSKVTPGFSSAMGRVLLADLPEPRRKALVNLQPRDKLTQHTIVDEFRVNERIAQARTQGFCIVEEEVALDGIGIAMPIFGPDGKALAALDVGCVASRYTDKRDHILGALKACIAGLPAPFCRPRERVAAAHEDAADDVLEDAM